MQKESRWDIGMTLLGAASGALINATVGWIFAVAGFLCFIPEVRSYFNKRGARKHTHIFKKPLKRGSDLINEVTGGGSGAFDQDQWKSKVILWDRDVRDLLLKVMPPQELVTFKHIGVEFQQGQNT